MSETKQKETEWLNVGVAYLSNSGKALNLSVFGKICVIPRESLEKVLRGEAATVSVSSTA